MARCPRSRWNRWEWMISPPSFAWARSSLSSPMLGILFDGYPNMIATIFGNQNYGLISQLPTTRPPWISFPAITFTVPKGGRRRVDHLLWWFWRNIIRAAQDELLPPHALCLGAVRYRLGCDHWSRLHVTNTTSRQTTPSPPCRPSRAPVYSFILCRNPKPAFPTSGRRTPLPITHRQRLCRVRLLTQVCCI